MPGFSRKPEHEGRLEGLYGEKSQSSGQGSSEQELVVLRNLISQWESQPLNASSRSRMLDTLLAPENEEEVNLVPFSGSSWVRRAQGGRQVPCCSALALQPGDGVLLSGDGYAQMQYRDGSVLVLAPNTQLHLGGGRGDFAPSVQLRRGRVFARIAPQSSGGFSIATPQGRVSVLGTEFDLGVRSDGLLQLTVASGSVRFVSNCVSVVRDMVLESGQMFSAKGEESHTRRLRPGELRRETAWASSIQPSQKRNLWQIAAVLLLMLGMGALGAWLLCSSSLSKHFGPREPLEASPAGAAASVLPPVPVPPASELNRLGEEILRGIESHARAFRTGRGEVSVCSNDEHGKQVSQRNGSWLYRDGDVRIDYAGARAALLDQLQDNSSQVVSVVDETRQPHDSESGRRPSSHANTLGEPANIDTTTGLKFYGIDDLGEIEASELLRQALKGRHRLDNIRSTTYRGVACQEIRITLLSQSGEPRANATLVVSPTQQYSLLRFEAWSHSGGYGNVLETEVELNKAADVWFAKSAVRRDYAGTPTHLVNETILELKATRLNEHISDEEFIWRPSTGAVVTSSRSRRLRSRPSAELPQSASTSPAKP